MLGIATKRQERARDADAHERLSIARARDLLRELPLLLGCDTRQTLSLRVLEQLYNRRATDRVLVRHLLYRLAAFGVDAGEAALALSQLQEIYLLDVLESATSQVKGWQSPEALLGSASRNADTIQLTPVGWLVLWGAPAPALNGSSSNEL